MARHRTHRQLANPINWRRGANNGQIPQSWIFRRAAVAMNQFALYMPKSFCARSENMRDVPGYSPAADPDRTIWTCCGRTGVATTRVRHHLGLARGGSAKVVGDNSRVFIVYSDLSNGTVVDAETSAITYPQGAKSIVVTPGEIHWAQIEHEVEADTVYQFTLEARNFARPVNWTCMEVPGANSISDGTDGGSSPAPYINGGPIYSQDIEDLLYQATALLKKNGPHLLNWCGKATDVGPFPASTALATYQQHGLSDEFITPVRYHRRRSRTTVPVEFAVLAYTSGASDNGVRLVDADSGAQLIELTGFSPTSGSDWVIGSGAIPATTRAVKIELKGDGVETTLVFGVALWEYEADATPSHSLDLESGSSQYASITDGAQTRLDIASAITIEAWVKFESLPSSGNFVTIAGKYTTAGNQRSYLMALVNDAGTYRIKGIISGDGATGDELDSAGIAITTGTWVHLAVAWDAAAGTTPATRFGFYADGIAYAGTGGTDADPPGIFNSTAPFIVGSDNGANFLDGKIFGARLWSVARHAKAIAAMRFVTLAPQSGLVGYWYVDDSHRDWSGNGNTLTASGSPVFDTDRPYA